MKPGRAAARRHPAACRYVALCEEFTEGVGDPDRHLPNGVRGWADRVAEGLAAAAPGWEYANLALRNRRLSALLAEQLPAALELEPTVVSISVGPRDILVSSTKRAAMLERLEFVVSVLAETGATVVLFTSPDATTSDPGDDRRILHNAAVGGIARAHGAVLVDPWGGGEFRAERMWDPEGTHLSRIGHSRLADHVLQVLGVAPADEAEPGEPRAPAHGTPVWMRQMRNWLTPAPTASPGATETQLRPRWPVPVLVPARGGLRSLPRGSRPPLAPHADGLVVR